MDPFKALLLGVIVPGALALITVVALRRPWHRERIAMPGAPGLALALAYAVTFGLLLGWPGLPPVDVTRVSPWVGLLLAPVAFLNGGRARAGATALVGALVGVFLVLPLRGGGAGLLIGVPSAIALTFFVLERGLDRALERSDPRGGALATTVLISGAAAAVLFSDVASLAQVTGGLAAAAGAVFTLGLWRPAAADLRRAAPVIAAILASNLWSSALYANGRYEVIALIALAPFAVVIAHRAATRPLIAIARPAAIIVLPVALAVFMAGSAYFASADDAAPLRDHDGQTAPAADPDYGY